MSEAVLWPCGTLGKVHGLRGELYLNPAADGLERLRKGERFYVEGDPGGPLPCVVTRVGGTDRRPLIRLDVAATREAAIALQGRELLAAGARLEELPHYRVGDLLGLPVRTAAGHRLGEVRDVLEAPAHEILVLAVADGSELLVPLVDVLVSRDDDGLVVVDGLLDESDDRTDI